MSEEIWHDRYRDLEAELVPIMNQVADRMQELEEQLAEERETARTQNSTIRELNSKLDVYRNHFADLRQQLQAVDSTNQQLERKVARTEGALENLRRSKLGRLQTRIWEYRANHS